MSKVKLNIRMTPTPAWLSGHCPEPKRPRHKLPYCSFSEYSTVHKDDYTAVRMINPNLLNGPWIAGGACLSWFDNRSSQVPGDIDVFCKTEKQAMKIIQTLEEGFEGYEITVICKTANASTFSVNYVDDKKWTIQVITCRYFDCIQDVIESFDISVCQVATDGNQWYLGKDTAKDINQKNLRITTIKPASLKRLIKYWTYGYTPVPGTIEAIQQNSVCDWDFIDTEPYENLI